MEYIGEAKTKFPKAHFFFRGGYSFVSVDANQRFWLCCLFFDWRPPKINLIRPPFFEVVGRVLLASAERPSFIWSYLLFSWQKINFFSFFKLTLNRWPCSRCRSYKNNEEHEYYVNRLILQRLRFGLLYSALWFVSKIRTTFLTNEMQTQNQSCVGRMFFPAQGNPYIDLLRILIGSLRCLRLLCLVRITLVLTLRHFSWKPL